MKHRKRLPKHIKTNNSVPRRRRGWQRRPDREDYTDFVLGDGSKLDLSDPDVCFASAWRSGIDRRGFQLTSAGSASTLTSQST